MFKLLTILIFTAISLNSQEIWTAKKGNGPPLFLIHGGPILNHKYLSPYLDSLANNFTIYFIDLPGRGKSKLKDSLAMGVKNDAEAIELIRNKYNLDKINILGHSFGGYVSLAYLQLYPKRVDKIILVSSPVGINQAVFDSVKKKLEPLFKNVSKEDNIKIIEKINFAKVHSRDYLKPWLDMMSEINAKSYNKIAIQYSDNLESDWLELFDSETLSFKNCSDISQGKKMLLIYGIKDLLAFPNYVQEFCSDCNNIEVLLFDSSAHIPFIDENNRFLNHINTFLKEK